MDQAPPASDRIADNRVIARVGCGPDAHSGVARLAFGLAVSGAVQAGSLPGHHFGSGLPGIALPHVLQPHARPARARFAPDFRAGRVPDTDAAQQAGRGDDDAAPAR